MCFRIDKSVPQHACDVIYESMHGTIAHIRELLHLAMWVEFYTIPPYLTAYFSIKSENNLQVKKILKRFEDESRLSRNFIKSFIFIHITGCMFYFF